MNEWRSEPPDEAGDWLWRNRPGAHPQCFRVIVTSEGYEEHGDDDRIWALPKNGQWLKVPE